MANLEDRKKAFESKYAHDAEMIFKAEARRNRKLAVHVAEKIGMSDEEAQAYGKELIAADMQEKGDDDVIRKIMTDAKEKGATLDEAALKAKSAELLAESKAEIMEEE